MIMAAGYESFLRSKRYRFLVVPETADKDYDISFLVRSYPAAFANIWIMPATTSVVQFYLRTRIGGNLENVAGGSASFANTGGIGTILASFEPDEEVILRLNFATPSTRAVVHLIYNEIRERYFEDER